MDREQSMDLAELVSARLEVVETLAGVLENYTSLYMKNPKFVNAAGKHVAGQMEVLLGVAGCYLTDIRETQEKLVSLLGKEE